MPIFRWIIICLAVWLVVVILRQLILSRRQGASHHKSRPAVQYSDTVACSNCNVHVPKAEALSRDGRYYCGTECLNRYDNDHGKANDKNSEQD